MTTPGVRDERDKEYAARLPPITDLNLPPTQRPFSEGDHPSLYLGFQCPLPWPIGTSTTTALIEEIGDRVDEVNKEVEATLGMDWQLTEVVTVNECPLNGIDFHVVAFYLNVHRKVKDDSQTKKKMKGLLEVLHKACGDGVEGPKWFWSLGKHGAGAHGFEPFDEAYPSGCPIFTTDHS